MFADLVSLEIAIVAAFILRLDTLDIPWDSVFSLLLVAPLIMLPVFVLFGLYRSVIRYLGVRSLLTVGQAVIVSEALLASFVFLSKLPDVPRSIVFIHGMLSGLFIAGTRLVAWYWLRYSDTFSENLDAPRKTVVIYGAGAAGVQLAAALANSREMRPVAFLDDNRNLHRKRIGNLEVYDPALLAHLVARYEVQEVLLAIPSISRSRRTEIIQELEKYPVQVRTLPGLAELAEGKIKTQDLREVGIEDLLGREPVAPIPSLIQANITGKVVMVTGAGGSIGSELCRQILNQLPATLVLYELNEYALYSIEQDLLIRRGGMSGIPVPVIAILGSVCDQERLERAIARFGVQTIYHAAAYKHVPMVERNPGEGVRNNVIGTWCCAHAALAQGVETFVLISTDKAVRPTNTMGASKRVAELILQALAERHPDGTRFTMVRFGNVLGSSGSVVPLFRDQIRRGGPITITDPRIIRYFMTIPEAAQLVIQAGAMGRDGDVFVLDMGVPVQIVDLARRMVHLSGLEVRDENNPSGDVEIVYTGLRPGEKLYEELLIGDRVANTEHPRIMRATESMHPLERMESVMKSLGAACEAGDSESIRTTLLAAVDGFLPQCGNEDVLGG
ncbi:nucleoside-diphosphate sugar epimerase/dehydratase [uncultured Azonexus sp.]|uniref:polysaccharide biosynthesis protein n=1 Tax=uncultured Azonexus sp. TaxID=520307 RepID=UPI00261E5BDD|nr:nucleoside-diphosphate sugar epimerase/dehydratase [uncultured Azonexus sp.]